MKQIAYTVTMDTDWILDHIFGISFVKGPIDLGIELSDGSRGYHEGPAPLSRIERIELASGEIWVKFGKPGEIPQSDMDVKMRVVYDVTLAYMTGLFQTMYIGNQNGWDGIRKWILENVPSGPSIVHSIVVADFGGAPAQIDFDLEFIL